MQVRSCLRSLLESRLRCLLCIGDRHLLALLNGTANLVVYCSR